MENDSKITVVIDTETTGLGHYQSRDDAVIQVGIAWRDNFKNINTWGSLCFPGKKYFSNGRADAALAINKLNIDDVFNAKKDSIVAKELQKKLQEIESASKKELELTAYNIGFDKPFLAKKPWKISPNIWGDCVMLSTAEHFGRSRIKLEHAVTMLCLKPSGRLHDAAVDAECALLVLEKIKQNKKHS